MLDSPVHLSLNGDWSLADAIGDHACAIAIPGDVHSALLAAGRIPDPYFGRNEDAVQWVIHRDWEMERVFDIAAIGRGVWTLTLDGVDTVADVILNDQPLGRLANQFHPHHLDVTGVLVEGENRLLLRFPDAIAHAAALAKAHPFEVPHSVMGYGPHAINFLRKTQCDAGWDWNIGLMPLGIRGGVTLERHRAGRIVHLEATQHHEDGRVRVDAVATLHAHDRLRTEVTLIFNGEEVVQEVDLHPGDNRVAASFTVAQPRLWWPAGHGDRPMYPLTVMWESIGLTRRLGLRTLDLVTEDDADGTTFKFRVNGRDIFMKGANWIPGDALPARITKEAVLPQLRAAVAANMNMLRIWGGGQYEPDWFFDACDSLGILIWQDFMFSCMHYPSDRAFLASVRREAEYQVRRLSHRPSLALWCGDNEIVGALGWYDVTKKDRDRYLVNYDRLNRTLEDVVAEHDPARRFWPSSPSTGPLDFHDGWHVDTRGDMHFWDVWHAAAPFEKYREVRPRFCSEFGFQSFPSMASIATFADPEDRNVSSPVMETHQRNKGGNARMVETMTRYFRFPKDFDWLVWLSQVQQALAMKTAIDFWRSIKPRCMGTLYWQLNDTWPVASWSSIEYGGRWKLLHHMAARFYAPVVVVAIPESGRLRLLAVSDRADPVALVVTLEAVALTGARRLIGSHRLTVPPDRSVTVADMALTELGSDEFLAFAWAGDRDSGTDVFVPKPYKDYRLESTPVAVTPDASGVTLTAETACFFVTVEAEGGRFDDNGITLLPGVPRRLAWLGEGAPGAIRVRHLGQSF